MPRLRPLHASFTYAPEQHYRAWEAAQTDG
ncbi:hypothetical protein QF035_000488 [Streptomyces umbrinus]|uniref:Uncharacterized protein n=1 Tax=Streptomyces umbrinus TaxID=67370 RepID=A0ABU0SH73_9ACTN|nr:hypothetical protein [Streptomyces umbrinus]